MLILDNLYLAQDGFELRANWQLEPGCRAAIIGPSGAGKSTLLSAISGFFPATAGRILWGERDLSRLSPGKRPLSILFQDQNLFPHLTLAQNLGLGLRPDLRLNLSQKREVDTALEQVGLAGMGPRKPHQLSGGQASRAALARVLLRARPLLLLDEPFAALGPALKADMLALLDQVVLQTKASVLMVTHDPQDALDFASQVVVLADSVANPPQSTAEVLANPPPALAAYLGQRRYL